MISKQSSTILLVFLASIIILSFWPSLFNGFLNWDDSHFITENSSIRSLTWENIKGYFFDFQQKRNYFPLPLVSLSFAIEYYFVKLNPFLYHLTNLVFHILNALLVYWLFLKLTKKRCTAFIVALLFGIHPMHVESVAWVTERKDVLSAFFFISSLICYINFIGASLAMKKRMYFYGSFLCFLSSILCKPMGVTMPLILILVDYFLERKWSMKIFLEKLPFAVVAVLFSGLTIFNFYLYRPYSAQNDLDSLGKMAVACYGILFYFIKLFIPINLSAFYPYPQGIESPGLSTVYWASIVVVLVFSVMMILWARCSRKILFVFLFFIITLLPILQIFLNSSAIVCDRYTYIPYLGLFYLIGEGGYWLFVRQSTLGRRILIVIFTTMGIVLSFFTWQRCRVWHDSETLWSDVLFQYPKVWFAYDSRGGAYKEKGNLQKALIDYDRVIEICPDNWKAYNNRGMVYFAKNDYHRAIADYTRSIKLNPIVEETYNNRAKTYAALRLYDQAFRDFNRALEINPGFALAYENRGVVYLDQGNIQKALADYDKAIYFNPDYAEAIVNRGTVYLLMRNGKKAIEDYQHALKIDSNLAVPYWGIGVILESAGNKKAAIIAYKEFLKLTPNKNPNFVTTQEKLKQLEVGP